VPAQAHAPAAGPLRPSGEEGRHRSAGGTLRRRAGTVDCRHLSDGRLRWASMGLPLISGMAELYHLALRT